MKKSRSFKWDSKGRALMGIRRLKGETRRNNWIIWSMSKDSKGRLRQTFRSTLRMKRSSMRRTIFCWAILMLLTIRSLSFRSKSLLSKAINSKSLSKTKERLFRISCWIKPSKVLTLGKGSNWEWWPKGLFTLTRNTKSLKMLYRTFSKKKMFWKESCQKWIKIWNRVKRRLLSVKRNWLKWRRLTSS